MDGWTDGSLVGGCFFGLFEPCPWSEIKELVLGTFFCHWFTGREDRGDFGSRLALFLRRAEMAEVDTI